MLTDEQRRFLDAGRVARFASADRSGRPHVVPICYAVSGESVYFSIDEKPKRDRRAPLKRLANIDENPHVAVVVDHYEEDWRRLGWVMLRGRAEVLRAGVEHEEAQAMLRSRYPQLRKMRIDELPVVAIRVEKATAWGDLSAG